VCSSDLKLVKSYPKSAEAKQAEKLMAKMP
jgi:hypothetical protein